MKNFIFLIPLLIVFQSCLVQNQRKISYNPTEFKLEVASRLSVLNQEAKLENGKKLNLNQIKPPYQIDDNIIKYSRKCIGNAPNAKNKVEKLKGCLQLSSKKIEYSQFANYNAVQCFSNKIGNCFSITNLAIGMAREMGLHAYYILVEDMIGNQDTGKYIVHTNHIVCGILLKNYMSDGVVANQSTFGLIQRDLMMIVDFIPNPRKYRYTIRLTDIEATGLFYNNIASGKMMEGKYKEAKAYFKLALSLYPNSYQIHNNLGVLYLKLGVWNKAEIHFEKALVYVKFPDLIMSNIVRHYERIGKPEKVEIVLKKLENAKRRNPYFYIAQSKKNIIKGNSEKALVNLKIAKKINSNLPEVYSLLSKVYKTLGNERKSKKYWKKFTKMAVAKVE